MKQQRQVRLFLIAGFLAVVTLLYAGTPDILFRNGVSAARQTTNSAIQNAENQIKVVESKIAALEKKSKNLQNSIASAEEALELEQQKKALLDEKLALVDESIAATQNLIAEYANQITQKEQEIAQKEADITSQYQSVLEWMRISYEFDEVNYLEMIFSAENLSDFLNSAEMFTSMMNYQNSVMDSLNTDLTDLRAEKDVLDVYRNAQKETRNKLELQQANYDQLIAESNEYIHSLNQTITDNEAAMAANEKQQAALAASRAALEKHLQEELEKLAQQNAVYVGGTYIWPLNAAKYKRVSSYFGWRKLNGRDDFHNAIDIPCDYGTDVWAANAGKVIKAEWHSSYGYYVVVDHGGGQTTLYAHNSRLVVKAGDTVQQGQVIAKAGATGSAWGVHCHFEVRINGKATNPLDGYVSIP